MKTHKRRSRIEEEEGGKKRHTLGPARLKGGPDRGVKREAPAGAVVRLAAQEGEQRQQRRDAALRGVRRGRARHHPAPLRANRRQQREAVCLRAAAEGVALVEDHTQPVHLRHTRPPHMDESLPLMQSPKNERLFSTLAHSSPRRSLPRGLQISPIASSCTVEQT